MDNFEFFPVHSLVNILPSVRPVPFGADTALSNERYSYQLALFTDTLIRDVTFRASPQVGVTVRRAGFIPVLYPAPPDADDAYISKEPQIYPDPLYPVDSPVNIAPGVWNSFFVTVDAARFNPGRREIKIELLIAGGVKAAADFVLTVLPHSLPADGFLYTNWVHYDCIARSHRVKLFSPAFYKVFARYLDNAVSHGMNMLLTPMFTPPLDTERGGERLTAQLVDVDILPDGGYAFRFDRLEKFMRFAGRHGIRRFEMSHLFTQWGAEACPKIIAEREGVREKIFGWHTPSDSSDYAEFLSAFLPALNAFLEKNSWKESVFFHLSDEPPARCAERYTALKRLVKEHLSGCQFYDALSDPLFYESGSVEIPVVSASHYDKFCERGHSRLWAYTCCSDYKNYIPNRFIAMPPVRNRALGTLLYLYGCPGYLHWGYNFYNSYLSRRAVEPYAIADADMTFPAGDAFIVYPYADGVIDSSRHEVFFDGLQDRRLLLLAEEKLGRDVTLALLEKHSFKSFSEYPPDLAAFTALRTEIHALLTT